MVRLIVLVIVITIIVIILHLLGMAIPTNPR